jgi:aromatic ring-cleaving dioxygenase
MTTKTIDMIKDWHIHVYYEAATKATAETLYKEITTAMPGLQIGRMHDQPVGPHPYGSFQVLIPNERLAEVTSWFSLNRRDLTVLLHPNTENDLKDHRDYPVWFGSAPKLNYEMFENRQ